MPALSCSLGADLAVALCILICSVGESNFKTLGSSGVSLAVYCDQMMFYVMLALWILWNIRVSLMARGMYTAINAEPVGRVGSDMEKASIKKKETAAKALDTEQNVKSGTNKPKYSAREARVAKDLKKRKAKKDELKKKMTRYNDDQKTLRLRRAWGAATYMGMSFHPAF